MGSSVRKIFTSLIGTIALIITIAIFMEYINVTINGALIKGIVNTALDQSFELYAQESYKVRLDSSGTTTGGTVRLPNIEAYDPTTGLSNGYADGAIYSTAALAADPAELQDKIYGKLYSNDTSDFRKWLTGSGTVSGVSGDYITMTRAATGNTDFAKNTGSGIPYDSIFDENGKHKGLWENLDYMLFYYAGSSADKREVTGTEGETDDWDDDDWNKYTATVIGSTLVNQYVTPINCGVAYTDKDTLNDIFQWNLATLLGNCEDYTDGYSHVIRCNTAHSGSEGSYILRNGYRIYTESATISNMKYTTYDLEDENSEKAFRRLTNVDMKDKAQASIGDERNKVCVITVEYQVPVSYEGISPLKKLFEYVWTSQVKGWRVGSNSETSENWSAPDYSDMADWDDSTQNLVGGATDESANYLSTGTITYYIVR